MTLRLMLAPALLGLVVLIAIPVALTVLTAFRQDDLLGPATWVGLANFRSVLGDNVFWGALGTSILLLAVTVPARLLGAVSLGLLLHRPRRGARWQRAAVLAPSAMPDIAVVAAWAFLLNPLAGPVNGLLGAVGLPQPAWFATPTAALAAIALMSAFTFGEGFLIALAARRELPGELFEAARLEGASGRHVLRRITLPLLAPVLGLLAARDIAVALQASFVPVYLLTDGGPYRSTLTLPVHIYDVGFEQFRYGEAAAMTVALLAVTLGLVALQWRALKRWRDAATG